MLRESTCFRKIYIACGRTDLRKGIDGLAAMIRQEFNLDPFEPNILFLFCGTKKDRIKGLVWEGDGFVLLYKRVNAGNFQWPRTTEEVASITPEQFHRLLDGLTVIETPRIKKDLHPKYLL